MPPCTTTTRKQHVCVNQNDSIAEAAEGELMSMTKRSALQQLDSSLHRVDWADVEELSMAGIGSFCDVLRVHIDSSEMEPKEYALKCLSFDRLKALDELEIAARDLVAEGEMLSRINHKNVITLHALTSGGPGAAFRESDKGYFLILDLLHDTLGQRLKRFRRRSFKRRNLFRSPSLPRLEEIGKGIAEGMEYLHKSNILLRDLKPDNIGFDFQGNPKIFDLGLAREVHMIPEAEVAGSLRYMAPEAALATEITFSSDIYSFGVLLWEMCTLNVPYEEYKTGEDFRKNVIADGKRPSVSGVRSKAFKDLIPLCWNQDQKHRPSFTDVVAVMDRELTQALHYSYEGDEFGSIESSELSVIPDSPRWGSRKIKRIGSPFGLPSFKASFPKPTWKPLARSVSEPQATSPTNLPPPLTASHMSRTTSDSAVGLPPRLKKINPLRKRISRGRSEPTVTSTSVDSASSASGSSHNSSSSTRRPLPPKSTKVFQLHNTSVMSA